MKRDNRIVRPEQMTQQDNEIFGQAIQNILDKEQAKDEARAEETRRKIESGEYIEKDGKIYDARYYRG